MYLIVLDGSVNFFLFLVGIASPFYYPLVVILLCVHVLGHNNIDYRILIFNLGLGVTKVFTIKFVRVLS